MTTSRTTESESGAPLQWALAYARAGFAVIPVWPAAEDGQFCSCEKGEECPRPAKHPIPSSGIKQATTDTGRVTAWWKEHPDANIAVATGKASGCIVIDVDTNNGKQGDVSLTSACGDKGGIPVTLKARSGSGGAHYIYRWRENPYTRKIGFLKDVDYLSDGGYVIVQPSRNLSGEYRFDDEAGIRGPRDIERLRDEMAELPEWFDKLEGMDRRSGRKAGRQGSTVRRPNVASRAALEFNAADPRWVRMVREALRTCDPDSRDLWVLFGIILGRAFERNDDGWTLYEEWAARSSKFTDTETTNFMRTYYYKESLSEPQSGSPANIGTLFHHATEGGWSMPPQGVDERPVVMYHPGRAIEVTERVLSLLALEREANGDQQRVFSFGSGLGEVVETHDAGAIYLSNGQPPNGWVMKVSPYTPVLLGNRITHTCTMMRMGVTGNPMQSECPNEVSQHILNSQGRRFPRLNGIVQWPLVLDGKISPQQDDSNITGDYDARLGLLFSLSDKLAFESVKGTKESAAAAWTWLRNVALSGFPFGTPEDEAGALAMLLTFMQRRALDSAPAFLITAPLRGTGKTTLVKFASRAVHGRNIGAASLSLNDEEQRKTITAALLNNPPALLFDNLTAGSVFDSDQLAIAMTSSEWEDRKLGSTERLTLPNRAVWCFTGNNVSPSGDMRRRIVGIRMVPAGRAHFTQHFDRNIETWPIEHRSDVISALLEIAVYGQSKDAPALPSESGFPAWDKAVRRAVLAVCAADPYRGASTAAEDEDPVEQAIGTLMIAWSTLLGSGKHSVREFIEIVDTASKSQAQSKRSGAADVVGAIALVRGKEESKVSSLDWGHALKSLQDRLVYVANGESAFRNCGLKSKVAMWQLEGAQRIRDEADNQDF